MSIATTLAAFCPSATNEAAAQQTPPAGRELGTIKAIQDNTITLTTDSGSEIKVVVQEATRMARVEPGQKDLKGATAIQLKDLQPGDRILVRGQPGADPKTTGIVASSIIVMKSSDLAAKQQREREDWQKRGIGGLVSAVDPAASIVTISVASFGGAKNVAIHTAKDTVIRRYAPDSVKFDDAKLSTLAEIKSGDQVRARGTRGPDGAEFAAEEIVSGSFRNIAGTISSVDAAANSVSVNDLIAKKSVVVKISSESQIRKLPPEMAQRIAMRLRAAAGGGAQGQSPSSAGNAGAAPQANPQSSGEGARGPGGAGGRAGGGGDLNQFISRLPPASLADLQKGDAVMIVSTEGAAAGQVTAITLLGGVEQILEAAARGGQSMQMLSPWTLGGTPGGDAGASP